MLSVAAVLALTVICAPGLAEADGPDPIGKLTINGVPSAQSPLKVRATIDNFDSMGTTVHLPDGSCCIREDDNVNVANSGDNGAGNSITEIDGTIASNSVGMVHVAGGFTICNTSPAPGSSLDTSFQCRFGGFFAAGPTEGETFFIQWTDRYYRGGLNSLNVVFNYGQVGACPSGAADLARAPGQPRAMAADNCTPPSQTKITEAQIKAHTAFFRFKARGATGFECLLSRNNRILFQHSCHSPKPYATRLPPGRYRFTVTGVNRAGIDPRPAVKKFTIK